MNASLIFPIDCINGVPSVDEFFASLKWMHKWILLLPIGFWFMTVSVFVVNLHRVITHGAKETKSNVIILLTLYPVSIFMTLNQLFILTKKPNKCKVFEWKWKKFSFNLLLIFQLTSQVLLIENKNEFKLFLQIVACTSLISIFMPRTYFFCDTIAHICFVITSYQFYRYCINCIEGESSFIAISTKESFTLQAPPLCCCCLCFKRSNVTK